MRFTRDSTWRTIVTMRRLTTLENVILGLLRGRAQCGYDLRLQFVATPLRHFSDSPGSIYPALARLRRAKLIAIVRSGHTSGRRTQILEPTSAGKDAFRKWLSRPVTRADVVWNLDEVLLRFAFSGGFVEKAVVLRILDELQLELEGYIAELRKYLATAKDELTLTGYLAVQQGVEKYEASLRWAQRVRKEIVRRAA